jgi:hypothetical protein
LSKSGDPSSDIFRASTADLEYLFTGSGERVDVEHKAWMNVAEKAVRADLAQHIAALANHGGGYLVFGIENGTCRLLGPPPADHATVTQDRIAEIVRTYLDPPVQVHVRSVEKDGVRYPVVQIESHKARPVIGKKGGETPKGEKPKGIVPGRIYIRAVGPSSTEIQTSEQWSELLDRCLLHRGDYLATIMRQSLSKPAETHHQVMDRLKRSVDATSECYAEQFLNLAPRADLVGEVSDEGEGGFALGYALIDGDGRSLELAGLHGLINRAALGMERYASNGWYAFFPRAVQAGTEGPGTQESTYLESRRLNREMLAFSHDYWRLYHSGVGVWTDIYREDLDRSNTQSPYLVLAFIVLRLHSILAHARFIGQQTPGVMRVLVRQDWQGLRGRILSLEKGHMLAKQPCVEDRFTKTMSFLWSELRDDYFSVLLKSCLSFLDVFSFDGWSDTPEGWLTREYIERELAKFETGRVQIFEN